MGEQVVYVQVVYEQVVYEQVVYEQVVYEQVVYEQVLPHTCCTSSVPSTRSFAPRISCSRYAPSTRIFTGTICDGLVGGIAAIANNFVVARRLRRKAAPIC